MESNRVLIDMIYFAAPPKAAAVKMDALQGGGFLSTLREEAMAQVIECLDTSRRVSPYRALSSSPAHEDDRSPSDRKLFPRGEASHARERR
jgi:hypothetical protein